jgi:hypothetical protein
LVALFNNHTPLPPLFEITLRALVVVPPIVLVDVPSITIPSAVLPSDAEPAALVPT